MYAWNAKVSSRPSLLVTHALLPPPVASGGISSTNSWRPLPRLERPSPPLPLQRQQALLPRPPPLLLLVVVLVLPRLRHRRRRAAGRCRAVWRPVPGRAPGPVLGPVLLRTVLGKALRDLVLQKRVPRSLEAIRVTAGEEENRQVRRQRRWGKGREWGALTVAASVLTASRGGRGKGKRETRRSGTR